MDEKEFLRTYNAHDYDSPLSSVDTALFTYHENSLKILLIERLNHPEKGKWCLPGGFVDLKADTTIEDTAKRKVKEKTGVVPPYLEQLQSIGNATRDKRGWSITVCYTALIAYQKCSVQIETVSDARWFKIDELNQRQIAFDHADIIELARQRLKQKALYSIVPAYCLPDKFTLPELQQIHEELIGKPLQKKSFRRRIEQANLLIETGEKRSEGGRPAALYKMRAKSGSFTFVRNLEE